MFDFILNAGKAKVLASVGCVIVLIAVADWAVGNSFSLGILYILPVMLGALVLGSVGSALLALLCAVLRSCFDTPCAVVEAVFRFLFAAVSYFACGLFVAALVRNRRFAAEALRSMNEQRAKNEKDRELRQEAEEQLRLLVESSPAGILTLDARGVVLAANDAANRLFAVPEDQTLIGQAIVDYLPVLSDALQLENVPDGFRTAAQCQGRRADGNIFLAHTWFSSYPGPEGVRLAAIVVDSSEEMRDREEQNLRLLHNSNRITAAAVSHELRTLCGAISLVSAHLSGKRMEDSRQLSGDEDFQALANLVEGLKKLASLELRARASEAGDLQEVPLKRALGELRIVIESDWQGIDGEVHWHIPDKLPVVFAEPHGLLQAFLNLAQNSHRAVQECSVHELDISVELLEGKVLIRFHDTGPGLAYPERLFQPFQLAADGAGLGLFVSRVVVRSYGGDLRFEPCAAGTCFVIELQAV